MFRPSSTIPTPCGNCWQCGGQMYEFLVHHCPTAVRFPNAAANPAWTPFFLQTNANDHDACGCETCGAQRINAAACV